MKRIGTLICALLVLFLAPLAGAQIYTVTNLGTLGGTYSVATGINDFGRVVGVSSTTGDVDRHAFLRTKTGGMQDLGTLGGGNSFGFGINNFGQVVGLSLTPSALPM